MSEVEFYRGHSLAMENGRVDMSKYGINVNLTSERMPLKQQTVIVAGGLAMWDGGQWFSMMDGSRHKPISWSVSWWADLPNSVCPPKFCDENGWPLVPCDPAAIPDGHEPVRVGWPKVGEVAASLDKSAVSWTLNYAEDISPRLIIRPIKPPIELPASIVPPKHWVWRMNYGSVYVGEEKPNKLAGELIPNSGKSWLLPPWIAAQLPQEWHDLPWDQSAVQQKEGGEG